MYLHRIRVSLTDVSPIAMATVQAPAAGSGGMFSLFLNGDVVKGLSWIEI